MASYTPNLNLIKPADADSYDVANDNGNMDKIDAAYASLNSKFAWTSLGEKNVGSLSNMPPAGSHELLIIGYKTSLSAWETVSVNVPLIGSSQNCSVVGKDTIMVAYITSSGQVSIPDSSGSNITKFTVYYR